MDYHKTFDEYIKAKKRFFELSDTVKQKTYLNTTKGKIAWSIVLGVAALGGVVATFAEVDGEGNISFPAFTQDAEDDDTDAADDDAGAEDDDAEDDDDN